MVTERRDRAAADSFGLHGRTALVTGASRGIGAGIATAMALAGARVVLVGRGAEALEDVRTSIAAGGAEAEILPFDIANGDGAEDLFAAAEEIVGPVDTLVHAAGNQVRSPALAFEPQDWDAILDLHLRSAFLLAQSLGRRLTERSAAGAVVFVGSLTSRRLGLPGIAAYAAAKSGLLGLARTLAVEWAPHGIRVNTVLPGFVATEMTRDVDGTPEREALTMRAPLGRLGAPADIGAAAVYLASGAAGFVTGETITVDGGWSVA